MQVLLLQCMHWGLTNYAIYIYKKLLLTTLDNTNCIVIYMHSPCQSERLSIVKPAFHVACFGAVSALIVSARVPLRASAAFEKERFHYEHGSCFHERSCRAD